MLDRRILRPHQCIDLSHQLEVESYLERCGSTIIRLNGKGVIDHATFFQQAAKDLPQPEGLTARRSWDALSDNLYDQLSEIHSSAVTVLWSHPIQLAQNELETFLLALGTIEIELAEWKNKNPEACDAFVVFFGKGNAYRPWAEV